MAATSDTFTMTPAPSGKPRIAGDELVHEAFDGEQQEAVAIRDCRAVVAKRDGGRARQPKPLRDRRDVALRTKAAAGAQARGKLAERDAAEHQAAFFGNDRNPVSGSANGG